MATARTRLTARAKSPLRQNGLDVRLNTEVKEVTARYVRLGTGERIDMGLTVCSLGQRRSPSSRKSAFRWSGAG